LRVKRILLWTVGTVLGLPLLVLGFAVVRISLLDQTNGTLVAGGEQRKYLLYVPAAYDRATPTPLVISLHAGATWPAHQMNLSHWNRLADEDGFLVVYPAGTPQVFGIVRVWRTTEATVMKDVRFISDLIDTLQGSFNIDATRIFVTGMSNGGGLAFGLSCALSARLAAIGLVAAAQELPTRWCSPSRPVPVIAFHGTADPVVPFGGGRLGDPLNPVKPVYPPVQDWVAAWAERNHCNGPPAESQVAADIRLLAYSDCAGAGDVVLYTVLGGGHSWPGGKPPPKWRVGATSNSVDATALMWTFFQQHPLAPAQAARPGS
jgi:polyhydroxybutyrate depolymerase